MPWIQIDDHFDEHPKLAAVGPIGWAMWLAGLAYCNRNLTDGFIPWGKARALVSWQFLEQPNDDGKRKLMTVCVSCGMSGDDVDSDYVIGLLIDGGLWEEVDGGYQVHDYTDWQKSKAEIESIREKKIAAGQAGGQASAQARAKSNGQAHAQAKSKPNPNPNTRENPPIPPVGDVCDFESFWSHYPKREGPNPKKTARVAYEKALKSATPADILSGLDAYVQANRDQVGTRFFPMATTWLNQERWGDAPKPVEIEYTWDEERQRFTTIDPEDGGLRLMPKTWRPKNADVA